ncbi:hypothetical protein WA026_012397 [Henosepilachna vigintioctopunctata]|uniref:Uncharacterized protein n=1 Tax=Henosepilachna vigintioctopunctata TaxID=420089 RepID=A0AAW1UYQ4_9CUCU
MLLGQRIRVPKQRTGITTDPHGDPKPHGAYGQQYRILMFSEHFFCYSSTNARSVFTRHARLTRICGLSTILHGNEDASSWHLAGYSWPVAVNELSELIVT